MMIPDMMIQVTTTNQIKFRHEFKHQINQLDDFILSGRLNKIFKKDQHADSHGSYRVSSLYFDTLSDKALREKIDGVNIREKFRLRYYNDDTSVIKLEKKMKHNSLGRKLSANISRIEVEMILNNEIEFLLEKNNPLCIEFYAKLKTQQLKPKTIVIYDREPFIYEPGNVRITFDRNLRTTHSIHDFLNPNLTTYSISNNITILEVKYDHFLPEIVQKAVTLNNRNASAFSKYTVSRQHE